MRKYLLVIPSEAKDLIICGVRENSEFGIMVD